jgi:hypothetical protein
MADKHRIYSMAFAKVYPMLLAKAEKKGRTKEEVDTVIRWLTGYTAQGLQKQLKNEVTIETFFHAAPKPNPNRHLITGTICGVRIEEIDDPLMREVRYLDKLVDELAKGRPMEKILRRPAAQSVEDATKAESSASSPARRPSASKRPTIPKKSASPRSHPK